jgi:hypothetical protein
MPTLKNVLWSACRVAFVGLRPAKGLSLLRPKLRLKLRPKFFMELNAIWFHETFKVKRQNSSATDGEMYAISKLVGLSLFAWMANLWIPP